tara:strand:- start:10 stop:345 length:336 start_codon:yes stop_codon:yes gene_type:complete
MTSVVAVSFRAEPETAGVASETLTILATEVATSNDAVTVAASTVVRRARAEAAATVPEYATTSEAVSIASVYALATISLLVKIVASVPVAPSKMFWAIVAAVIVPAVKCPE